MEMDLFKKDVRVVYFESNRYLESAVRRKAVCCAWGTFLEWEVPRARPLVQIQNGPSAICVVSRPSFQLSVGKTVWPEEKKRNSFVYFFLLTGGYSSVGRALPLQWCRKNDSKGIIFAFLRGFTSMRGAPTQRLTSLPNRRDGDYHMACACLHQNVLRDGAGERMLGGQVYFVWAHIWRMRVRPGRSLQEKIHGWWMDGPAPVQAERYTHPLREHLGSSRGLALPLCSA